MTVATRFWAKVDKQGPTPTHRPELGPCWQWSNKGGYGYFWVGNGRKALAHRVSWELHFGPIAAGFVCHHCDNPRCVNPAHLFLGTQRQNIQDALAKGRLVQQAAPELLPRGERHHAAKLTASQVVEIRRRRAAGDPMPAIAKDFGVSKVLVRMIVNRRVWRHLEEEHAL